MVYWDVKDRVERHDLKSQLWLFFFPFLFPPKKDGRGKGEWIAKIMILSHAFLIDQCQKVLSDFSSLFFRREKDSQSCLQKSCLSAWSYLESRGAEVGP